MRKLACAVAILISLVFFFLILWAISVNEAAAFDHEIKCYSGGKLIFKTKMDEVSYEVDNPNILWIKSEKGKAVMVNAATCVLETDEDYVSGTE